MDCLVIRTLLLTMPILFMVGKLMGQQGPLRFPIPFEKTNSDTLIFRINRQIPDSNVVSFAGLRFSISGESGANKAIFLGLSNSGGLLAFQDSLFLKPYQLEKRSGFPFLHPKPDHHYALIFTCRPGPGDYAGFRLLSAEGKNQVLDEVFLCLPGRKLQLEFRSEWGWISIKKMTYCRFFG